jgi:hypothetical protein
MVCPTNSVYCSISSIWLEIIELAPPPMLHAACVDLGVRAAKDQYHAVRTAVDGRGAAYNLAAVEKDTMAVLCSSRCG